MRVNVEYLRWATHDKLGLINGIRDDAPDWVKKQYYDALNDTSGIV